MASLHSSLLQELYKSISKHDVDAVLVHGDTATTLAAAQASFYLKIPVGHIEAGLRTHDKTSPFPEEMNRRLTSSLSTWHFAPTTLNKSNLLKEGVPTSAIIVTGNTVVDSLKWLEEQIQNPSSAAAIAAAEFTKRLPFDPLRSEFAVITAHRRENIRSRVDGAAPRARGSISKLPGFLVCVSSAPKPRRSDSCGARSSRSSQHRSRRSSRIP